MIENVVEGGFIFSFSLGRPITSFLNSSHLLFASDTLVFCEAKHDHICALRYLFLCCEVVFGLKVNLGKLGVIPVGQLQNVDKMASILECKISHLPMKYLGCSLQIDIHLE